MINGGIIHKENPIKKYIKTYYLSKANYYLCPNKKSIEYLIYYGAKPSGIFIYPYSNVYERNFVKEIVSDNDKKCFMNTYFNNNKKTVIAAGYFTERKNNEQLIKVFKDIDANLLLIGEGNLYSKYIELIKIENITNVKILSYQKESDLFNIYRHADLFVTLSREDIFGHTVIESLANNLPVVSSDNVTSALDTIKNGVNGFIVSLNNNKEIIETINKALNINYGLISSTVENYTIEKSADEIYKLLKKL